jgi:hypothetical protein
LLLVVEYIATVYVACCTYSYLFEVTSRITVKWSIDTATLSNNNKQISSVIVVIDSYLTVHIASLNEVDVRGW